ncbi:hypothetical protein Q73_05870 [Bacillus coahuilensis m2-6]|nr:hypothetical protein Q73_05870 [Bacillus coahuilensis m2-6]
MKNPFVTTYMFQLKSVVFPVATQQTLLQEIEEKSKEFEVPAADAKIDPVWKTVPGYNGLKVDIQSSYDNMKEVGEFKEELLVYEQVSPSVHLTDLSPAPIYKGHPDKPMVSLTINVAWGNEYIPDMLESLEKHKVYATFFLEGRWVKENPEMAKMIAEAGHEIGNHSYSHPDLNKSSKEKTIEELTKTNEVIEATIGKRVKWFAPPSGSFNDTTVDVAATLKLGTILWSVDTIDWQKPAPSVIISRVETKLHPGAIILMHPTKSTAQALDTVIVSIKNKDLRLGTVSQLVKEERIVESRK